MTARLTHSAYYRKKRVEEVFGAIQGKVVYHENINLPTAGIRERTTLLKIGDKQPARPICALSAP